MSKMMEKMVKTMKGMGLNTDIAFKFETIFKDETPHIYMSGMVAPDDWCEEGEEHLSAKLVRNEVLSHKGKDIVIHLNSPGGASTEGIAIYNVLKDYEGNVTIQVDGIAASAASLILMGADKTVARTSSMVMIHHGWTIAVGNASELRKTADTLDKYEKAENSVYLKRFKGTAEELEKLLDDETYLPAEDAYIYGFIDEIINDDVKEEIKEPIEQKEQIKEEQIKSNLFKKFSTSKTESAFLFAKFRRNE